jgi:hypothetical protein
MKVLELPGIEFFGGWEYMQEYLKEMGNPLFRVKGDLNLSYASVKSLDNLVSVEGYLDLHGSEIESLRNLVSVGGYLDLGNTDIKSLGNLKSVGDNLYLYKTPLSKKYSEKEIRQQVEVGGKIYL